MPPINGSYTRMDQETLARVKKLCVSERRPVSQMLAILVEEALNARERKPATAEHS